MVQICGTILIGVALICGVWYAVTIRKIKAEADRKAREERNAHNERLAADNNFALYQQTEAALRDANVKIKIKDEQIKRRDKEIERLKKLLEGVSSSPFDKEVKA